MSKDDVANAQYLEDLSDEIQAEVRELQRIQMAPIRQACQEFIAAEVSGRDLPHAPTLLRDGVEIGPAEPASAAMNALLKQKAAEFIAPKYFEKAEEGAIALSETLLAKEN